MTSRTDSQELLRELVRRAEADQGCVLATVLAADGSSPVTTGAKALFDATGLVAGTVGGGAVEEETQRRATTALQSASPEIFQFALHGKGLSDPQPICGGTMRLLLRPVNRELAAPWVQALAALERRERGGLLTRIAQAGGLKITTEWIPENALVKLATFPGSELTSERLNRECAELFVAESSSASEACEVLVEPMIPKPVLLIVGGGHVGQAVAQQAHLVGFDLLVLDDRPEFTRTEIFPEGTETRCGEIEKAINAFAVNRETYIVIVTRGHQHDAVALAACLQRSSAYIGMIGSRRKVALMREEFLQTGKATAAEFDRVFAPVGLDIGSITVPEIAASIVAQLISVRRKGTAHRISLI